MLDKWLIWKRPPKRKIPLAVLLPDPPTGRAEWLKHCEMKNIHGIEFPIPNPKKIELLSMEDLVEIQKDWQYLGQRLLDNNENISDIFEFLRIFNSTHKYENAFKYLNLNIKDIIHTEHEQTGDRTCVLYSNKAASSQITLLTSIYSIDVKIADKNVFELTHFNGYTQVSKFIPGQWIFELETLVDILKNSKNIINDEKLKLEQNTLSAITSTLDL